jgi:hypothetical protein
MSEPWFDPNSFGWIPGTLLGLAGGIEGTLLGAFAPRAKLKALVMGVHFTSLGLCLVLLIAGLVAWLTGQPYGIWYGLGFPGLLGLIIVGSLTPMVRKRYAQAELRKSMAEDI